MPTSARWIVRARWLHRRHGDQFQLAQPAEQLVLVDRFDDVGVSTFAEATDAILGLLAAGDHHHLGGLQAADAVVGLDAAQGLENLVAVHAGRQADVETDKIVGLAVFQGHPEDARGLVAVKRQPCEGVRQRSFSLRECEPLIRGWIFLHRFVLVLVSLVLAGASGISIGQHSGPAL